MSGWLNQEALFAATGDQKQALMNSYPELARVVGEDEEADPTSSEHSLADQSAAGLNHLGEEDQSEFGALTAAYHDRFAFPLIVCVRDNPDRQHILDSGWARMHNSPAQERATALIEIANIANHRQPSLRRLRCRRQLHPLGTREAVRAVVTGLDGRCDPAGRSERVQGQQQVHPVPKPGQVPSGQLLDPRDPVPHRVDMQEQLVRCSRPRA